MSRCSSPGQTMQNKLYLFLWSEFPSCLWQVSYHPEIQLFVGHKDLTAFHFSFLFSTKNEVYSTNVFTRDKLLARIFDAFISINKRELQLRREASDIHTRVGNCIQFESGISEHVL
jgi:hypothetical protein